MVGQHEGRIQECRVGCFSLLYVVKCLCVLYCYLLGGIPWWVKLVGRSTFQQASSVIRVSMNSLVDSTSLCHSLVDERRAVSTLYSMEIYEAHLRKTPGSVEEHLHSQAHLPEMVTCHFCTLFCLLPFVCSVLPVSMFQILLSSKNTYQTLFNLLLYYSNHTTSPFPHLQDMFQSHFHHIHCTIYIIVIYLFVYSFGGRGGCYSRSYFIFVMPTEQRNISHRRSIEYEVLSYLILKQRLSISKLSADFFPSPVTSMHCSINYQ